MKLSIARVGDITHSIAGGDIRTHEKFVSACGVQLLDIMWISPDAEDTEVTCNLCQLNVGKAISYYKAA